MVTLQVATLPPPLIVGPLTVGVSPPVTVRPSVPKLGVPVPAGEAVTVMVKVCGVPTSLVALEEMLMLASTTLMLADAVMLPGTLLLEVTVAVSGNVPL